MPSVAVSAKISKRLSFSDTASSSRLLPLATVSSSPRTLDNSRTACRTWLSVPAVPLLGSGSSVNRCRAATIRSIRAITFIRSSSASIEYVTSDCGPHHFLASYDQPRIPDVSGHPRKCTSSTPHHRWDHHRHTVLLAGPYSSRLSRLGPKSNRIGLLWGASYTLEKHRIEESKCLLIPSNHPLPLLFASWTTTPRWQTRPDSLFAPLASGPKPFRLLRSFWTRALLRRPAVLS